uniref:ZP domain-containing protein n=1 Tax=Heterorhabditis bacteriophora TaxID=37862 RepID=A0A1I7XRL4_HETBA
MTIKAIRRIIMLQDSDYRLVLFDDLSEQDWLSLSMFDRHVTGENRPLRHLLSLENSCTAAIFNEKVDFIDLNECMGYGNVREMAGGFVRRLLVGPLFAKSKDIAQSLLKAVLKKYYNPSEDFDFDPDCFAIYRRNVHFLVPEDNPKIIDILELLRGKEGTIVQFFVSSHSMNPSLFIHLIALLHLSISISCTPLDNGVEGEPEIECGPTSITVNFNTRNMFNGHVYAKPHFLTKVDRSYRVSCFYVEAQRKVNSQMDIAELNTAAITGTVPMPICQYEILDGGPTGAPVAFGNVGQQVYHKWSCISEHANIFCMTVHSCFVDDGKGEKVSILTSKGCALDRFILGNLEYVNDLIAGQECPRPSCLEQNVFHPLVVDNESKLQRVEDGLTYTVDSLKASTPHLALPPTLKTEIFTERTTNEIYKEVPIIRGIPIHPAIHNSVINSGGNLPQGIGIFNKSRKQRSTVMNINHTMDVRTELFTVDFDIHCAILTKVMHMQLAKSSQFEKNLLEDNGEKYLPCYKRHA